MKDLDETIELELPKEMDKEPETRQINLATRPDIANGRMPTDVYEGEIKVANVKGSPELNALPTLGVGSRELVLQWL